MDKVIQDTRTDSQRIACGEWFFDEMLNENLLRLVIFMDIIYEAFFIAKKKYKKFRFNVDQHERFPIVLVRRGKSFGMATANLEADGQGMDDLLNMKLETGSKPWLKQRKDLIDRIFFAFKKAKERCEEV